METTVMGYIEVILGLYWGYIGIMEKKMETTGITGVGQTRWHNYACRHLVPQSESLQACPCLLCLLVCASTYIMSTF